MTNQNPTLRFEGQTVLVTGAVRNTGLAIAETFARAGATVALNGRHREDVVREADRLRKEFGVPVIECVADIARHGEVGAMFATIENETGRLDVLVNNAIVQAVGHSLIDTPREMLEETFFTNVFGTYYCCQFAARRMIAAGGGAIINVGSTTAIRAIRNRTAYVASKGAVDALTRAMALELGPHNIRVNSLVAGYIHTDRWATLTTEAARRRANVPLGREASGRDIANAVLFLASDSANGIHGAQLVVDGGVTIQQVPADCEL
jgi:NAD(P)-dependent dehydrogenase (short-subunit alcohol dehydrogenase family)